MFSTIHIHLMFVYRNKLTSVQRDVDVKIGTSLITKAPSMASLSSRQENYSASETVHLNPLN